MLEVSIAPGGCSRRPPAERVDVLLRLPLLADLSRTCCRVSADVARV
jgi:hypothetical protein